MKDRRALGWGYWILFSGLALYLTGTSIARFRHQDWGVGWIPLSAALWMAAATAWGRRRERELGSIEPERVEEAVRRIRGWCWGSLIMAVLTVYVLPVLTLSSRTAEQARARIALQQVGTALSAYRGREKHDPPVQGEAFLRALQQAGDLPASFPAIDYGISTKGTPASFPRLSDRLPAGFIPVLWENQALHPGTVMNEGTEDPVHGILVLTGQVVFLTETEFQAMLRQWSP